MTDSTKKQLAKTALGAVAPEVAVPLAALEKIVHGRRDERPAGPAPPTVTSSGDVVIAQLPPDPLFPLKKSKIRVLERRGKTIVVVQGARGLSAKEAAELAAAGGLLVLAYEASRAVKTWAENNKSAASTTTTLLQWTSPISWLALGPPKL